MCVLLTQTGAEPTTIRVKEDDDGVILSPRSMIRVAVYEWGTRSDKANQALRRKGQAKDLPGLGNIFAVANHTTQSTAQDTFFELATDIWMASIGALWSERWKASRRYLQDFAPVRLDKARDDPKLPVSWRIWKLRIGRSTPKHLERNDKDVSCHGRMRDAIEQYAPSYDRDLSPGAKLHDILLWYSMEHSLYCTHRY